MSPDHAGKGRLLIIIRTFVHVAFHYGLSKVFSAAAFIIGQGMLWGNTIGIAFILLQRHTGFIKLDPANYYVTTAPMELNIPLILLLNIATLVVTLFVLIVPSFLVSHIHPSRSMRYE